MRGPVICGIEDRSDGSVAAFARELAERYELPLVFVHVDDGDDDAAALVREVASGAGELAIESGHPADRLVELARERNASFLVVGNHGPRSSMLGSISADVSRRASCPVVVVPRTVAASAHRRDGRGLRGGIARFGLGHAVRRIA